MMNSSGSNIETNSTEFQRFGLNIRLQHIILMVCTILLIISGLPLKFYTTDWAKSVINLLGGTDGARKVHHFAALGLIVIGIYHLLFSIINRSGRRDFMLLIPGKKDMNDFFHQLQYFFGKKKYKPKFGRFSFIEKFDYWAVYWGFIIMIGSGIIMWMFQGKFYPMFFGEVDISFTSGIVDNYVHAISREAHSDEALLATLAILIWHFYNVHFNPDKFPGSKVWFSGKMTRKEMEEEHPLELEEIENRLNKKEMNIEKDGTVVSETEQTEVDTKVSDVIKPDTKPDNVSNDISDQKNNITDSSDGNSKSNDKTSGTKDPDNEKSNKVK